MLFPFLFILLFTSSLFFQTTSVLIESDIMINRDQYVNAYGETRYTSTLFGQPPNHHLRSLGSSDGNFGRAFWKNERVNGKYQIPFAFNIATPGEDCKNSTNLSDTDVLRTTQSMRRMENFLGNILEFVDYTDKYNEINGKPHFIIKDCGGCWSYIGQLSLQHQPQELSLGINCIQDQYIHHELMHVLGFYHEQNRADRDKYINIMWDNIPEDKQYNFQKKSEQMDSLDTPYDFQSIMHYRERDFSKYYGLQTIVPKEEYIDYSIGSRGHMTDIDMMQLRMIYRCPDVRSCETNCDVNCKCRLNEGKCQDSSGCEAGLFCVNNICKQENERPNNSSHDFCKVAQYERKSKKSFVWFYILTAVTTLCILLLCITC